MVAYWQADLDSTVALPLNIAVPRGNLPIRSIRTVPKLGYSPATIYCSRTVPLPLHIAVRRGNPPAQAPISIVRRDKSMNFINPKIDYAFKKIFGSEQSKDILISFLNALLYK